MGPIPDGSDEATASIRASGAATHSQILAALLDRSSDEAVVALDLDGVVTLWSGGATQMTGWLADDMMGQSIDPVYAAKDGGVRGDMAAALQQGSLLRERWQTDRDGNQMPVMSEMRVVRGQGGEPRGFLLIMRRLSQLQADLPPDADFLRSVLASSADCIKVLDLDANLVFMSEGGQRVMEVDDFNAVKGCPWPDFWQGTGNVQAHAAIAAAKAGRIGRFQGTADTMAGNPRFWDVVVTPITGPDGRPEKLLAVSRDISGTVIAERALREVQGLNAAVLDSSRDCIVVLDLEGFTRFVSPGGVEAMEVSDVDKIIGLSWLRVWDGVDHVAAKVAVATAAAGGTGRFQAYCATHRGTPKWWDVVISPLTGPDGRPEGLVSIGRDITEQHDAEAALRDTEERRRLAIEAADIGTWSLDCITRELQWDQRCKAVFGLPPDAEVTYETYQAGIVPEDRARVFTVTRAALEPSGAGTYQLETRTVGLADGLERWISMAGKTHFEDGRAVRMVGTVLEVTARKHAEEQARLLADELQHRVKNTMAMVQAIVRQSLRSATTLAEAQAAIDPRLAAMGRAHDILTRGSWEGSDLLDLVRTTLHLHDDGTEGRLQVAGPPAWIQAQSAMSLSLLLHELATNAAKYGALSVPSGRVALSWDIAEPAEPGGLCGFDLVWRESGGPPVKQPERRGFGSKLIERGLASALGGKATLSFAADGVVCHVKGVLWPHRDPAV